MNMETRHSIMPASGAKTKWLRFVLPLVDTSCHTQSLVLQCHSDLSLISLQDLVTNGAQVSICNKYGETPLDKGKPHLRELLRGILI